MEAITSVYAQTYKNWEIVFWDNASTDNTRKIASSFDSRLKYYCADENTPLGPARNLAMKRAIGTYVSFLDADDIFLPQAIERLVGLIESGGYAMVYAGTITIDEAGKTLFRRKPRYRSGLLFPNLLRRYDIPMCSAMIRKSIMDSEKLEFDQRLAYCPDYNLFMKIAAQYAIGTIPDWVVKYRRSANSLSRKTLHLVSGEQNQTLNDLARMYPAVVESHAEAMKVARVKLHYYDCIVPISCGDYRSARAVLKPAIKSGWAYFVIYMMLFLPIPKEWVLRILNR